VEELAKECVVPRSPTKAQIDWVRVGLLRRTRNVLLSIGDHDTLLFSAPTERVGGKLLFLFTSNNDSRHVRLIDQASRAAAGRGAQLPAALARLALYDSSSMDVSLRMQAMVYRAQAELRLAAREAFDYIRLERGEKPLFYDDMFIAEPYEALIPVCKESIPSRVYAGEGHQNIIGALRGFETY
jgi:hypothetical protein